MRHNTIHKLTAVAGMALLLLAGCAKDNTMLHIRINNFDGSNKVFMDYMTPTFEDGDAVCVNQKIDNAPTVVMTTATTGTMEVETDPNGYRAVYPNEYVNGVNGNEFYLNIPRRQVYEVTDDGKQRVKVPMGGVSDDNNHLTFHNLGAMLAVILVNDDDSIPHTVLIDSIAVEASNATLWGPAIVSDITDSNRHFECTAVGRQYRTVTLAGQGGSSLGIELAYQQACTLYVSVPMVSDEYDNRYFVHTYSHDTAFNIRYTRAQANPYSGCIQLNRLAFVTFPLDNPIIIPKDIDGLYSVGIKTRQDTIWEGNKQKIITVVTDTIKVDFSHKGNLQALVDGNGNPIYWQFANHQWDLIENRTSNDTVDVNLRIGSEPGWVDLFGHSVGTPGNPPTTTNNYGICMSGTVSDYQGTFVDWGTIPGVQSSEGYGWTTLSAAEWGFLLGYSGSYLYGDNVDPNYVGTDKNGLGRRYADRKFYGVDQTACLWVRNVPGIVFLPDVWHWTGSLADLEFNSKKNRDGDIYYTAEEWEIMEAAGAIFLPTGKQRQCTSKTEHGITTTTATYYAYAEGGLYATSDDDNPAHPIHNHNHGSVGAQYGLSVRLAYNRHDCPLPTPIPMAPAGKK